MCRRIIDYRSPQLFINSIFGYIGRNIFKGRTNKKQRNKNTMRNNSISTKKENGPNIKKIKIEKICITPLSQARGLICSKKKTLFFIFKKEKRIALHNIGVWYPINLIFLNKKMKVIETKINFRPFSFYTSKKKANYLIETPYMLKGISEGMKLRIEYSENVRNASKSKKRNATATSKQ